jgi:two-component system chemotaxis response regulator CheB
MDGVKFLRRLLPLHPLPVIVISGMTQSLAEAMEAGAVDFIPKPSLGEEGMRLFVRVLGEKIRVAAQAHSAFRMNRKAQGIAESLLLSREGLPGAADPRHLVAIGASTGGTEAIYSILTKYTANMPGIVVVQHMPQGFTRLFAERLRRVCELQVVEATDGERVEPGKVVIAPGGLHMRVFRAAGGGYAVRCEEAPKVNGHRPSVDVLFGSVAENVGRDAVGVILTGMGKDGALGLKRIRESGGYTIGQDERSSVVYGMPLAALKAGAVTIQLPLYRIADEILRRVGQE